MYADLKGKTALVTGAGKRTGIGYAIARTLAEHGANTIIADLGTAGGEDAQVATGQHAEMEDIVAQLQTEYGIKSLAVPVDVGSAEAITAMVARVSDHFKSVEILCNNAGASFGVPNAVHTYDEAAWMKTIDINLHSVFRVSRAI